MPTPSGGVHQDANLAWNKRHRGLSAVRTLRRLHHFRTPPRPPSRTRPCVLRVPGTRPRPRRLETAPESLVAGRYCPPTDANAPPNHRGRRQKSRPRAWSPEGEARGSRRARRQRATTPGQAPRMPMPGSKRRRRAGVLRRSPCCRLVRCKSREKFGFANERPGARLTIRQPMRVDLPGPARRGGSLANIASCQNYFGERAHRLGPGGPRLEVRLRDSRQLSDEGYN